VCLPTDGRDLLTSDMDFNAGGVLDVGVVDVAELPRQTELIVESFSKEALTGRTERTMPEPVADQHVIDPDRRPFREVGLAV
jgi:hypothetical protein